jgi:hypothetical protein
MGSMRLTQHVRPVAPLLVSVMVALGAACAGDAAPSRPSLVLSMASTVDGRLVTCESCQSGPIVVVDVPVTLSDPGGPGGVVAQVTALVMNRSRSLEVARNVRPNADEGLAAADLPPRGQLRLQAGVVAPLPPPRDELAVTVSVTLTDGRQATASARLVIAQ